MTIHLPPMTAVRLAAPPAALRPLRADDASALHAAAQDPLIARYTSVPWPFTRERAEELIAAAHADWAAGTAARFAITLDDALVGTASLLHIYGETSDAEIGYWLGAAGRGRGIATAATRALVEWAFGTLGFAQLHLLVDWDNAASIAVAHAAGFTDAGTRWWEHPTDPTKSEEIPLLVQDATAWRSRLS